MPVIGLAQSSFEAAARQGRFAVVTGGHAWGPMLTRFAREHRLDALLVGIHTIDWTGAQIAADPDGARDALVAAAQRGIDAGAECILLGGAALTGLAPPLQPRLAVPVLDNVLAGRAGGGRPLAAAADAVPMTRDRLRLGMLTPSSNTVLEPVTTAMIASLPEASAHFARFKVTEIALSREALGQFDDREILGAAELLSHAKVGVIGWSGTAASWRGFETDEALCRRVTEATGVPACTSVLALNELFARLGVRRFGLVTPYLDDVQARIIANYATAGYACAAERHLGLRDNFSFSQVDAGVLRTMVREVAVARPDAIVVLCTNLRGGPLVPSSRPNSASRFSTAWPPRSGSRCSCSAPTRSACAAGAIVRDAAA